MQYLNTRKAIGLILALAFFIGGTHTALAAGTASGTTISNTATVEYQVATDTRTATGLAPDITVDNRVDLTVANTGNVSVVPGSTNQVLTYTVRNDGNTPQGYSLTAINAAGNAFDMTNVRIYIEDGTTAGFQIGEDTLYTMGNYVFDLAADATSVNLYVVADTPVTALNTETANIHLQATTLEAGGAPISAAGGPTAGVDIVFADGDGPALLDTDRDGTFSSEATYAVTSALLSATKTITNTSDEWNATGGFAIPGAVVRYQITVTSGGTGTVDADSVVVSDPVPVNTRLCVSAGTRCVAADLPSIDITGSGLTSATLQYSDDNGATWTYTPTAPTIDAEGADSNITNVRYTTVGTMSNPTSIDVTIGVVID